MITISDTAVIADMGDLVNKYGFMVIFSVVVLILGIIFFTTYNRRNNKKQESEIEILHKEREASIEQNNQMFNLVTKVQTEQVIQLQQMTELLREMGNSIHNSEYTINKADTNIEKLRLSMESYDEHEKSVINTLSEILDYIKTCHTCNKEILDKIKIIESKLIEMSEE